MLARIRKAVVAGLGAAASAFVAALVNSATEGTINRDEVIKALGLSIVAGFTVGAATYKVTNAGTVSVPR